MVGKMESVDRIVEELPVPPIPEKNLNVPLPHKGSAYLKYLRKKLFPEVETVSKDWPRLFPEVSEQH